jgi:beta-lactamase superfamily II metal-dependent hydrolase
VKAAALAFAIGAACAAPPQAAPSSPPTPTITEQVAVTEPDGTVSYKAARTPHRGPVPANTCFVDFIDMGAGLSVFIRCRNASGADFNILYDGGTNEPRLNSQYRLVYILENGLGFMRGSTIHHIFQSHPHYDHHGDLVSDRGVIALYDVKHVWDPAMHTKKKVYGCFLHAVTKKQKTTDLVYHPAIKCPSTRGLECDGAPVGYFKQDQVKPYKAPSITRKTEPVYDVPFGYDGVAGKIIYSDPDAHEPNAAALVLKLTLFGVEILLTADEEAGGRVDPATPPDAGSVEAFLLEPARRGLLRAHIIQVPHHGSLTSGRNVFKDAAIWRHGTSVDSYAVISSGDKEYGTVKLPDSKQVWWWRQKLGAGRLLSTTTDDADCKTANPPLKIAPAGDPNVAGCTSVEFEIKKGSKIKNVFYWPAGPKVM